MGILLRILTKVDVTETAASDLAANTVLVPHAEVLQTVSDVILAGRGARGVQSRVGRWERHAPWWSCLRLTSRDEDLGCGEGVEEGGPTVCSVVVLRLRRGPAGVCGDARLVGVGRVVVRWWVVLVLESRREGDWWWWEVVESVSVGWQSARESAAGFGRRLAAAATGRAGLWARQEQARQRDSQQASKQSGVPRSGGERQATSRGERTSNARQQPFATSTQMGKSKACV